MLEAADILDKARAGDPRAFQELVRPHIASLRRFARSFCKNGSDADDLAQEVLVKAYRSFASFEQYGSLTTWLYAIAKHQFIDYRRSKLFHWRSRESELTESESESQPSPEGLLNEQENLRVLWTALQRIDEKYRTPLVLAEIDGLSYEEVAEIECIPIGTVRSRIARAKAQLRVLLDIALRDDTEPTSGTILASATPCLMTKDVR